LYPLTVYSGINSNRLELPIASASAGNSQASYQQKKHNRADFVHGELLLTVARHGNLAESTERLIFVQSIARLDWLCL